MRQHIVECIVECVEITLDQHRSGSGFLSMGSLELPYVDVPVKVHISAAEASGVHLGDVYLVTVESTGVAGTDAKHMGVTASSSPATFPLAGSRVVRER
jgi:hypothetical protein